MLNTFDEEPGGGFDRFAHMQRTVLLADALFRLQQAGGFAHLLQRFQNRATRPCYFEATVASAFLDLGYEVEIRQEIGVRGQDFDFQAARDQVINVEVTAKDGELSEKTIRNTLFGKRDQLPDDKPAVLYIVIPDEWAQDGTATDEAVGPAVKSFFDRSRRINAVVFGWSISVAIGEGCLFAEAFRPYFHPYPRHELRDCEFAAPRGLGDVQGLHEELARTANQDALARQLSGTRVRSFLRPFIRG